jgi:hypothetical protein
MDDTFEGRDSPEQHPASFLQLVAAEKQAFSDVEVSSIHYLLRFQCYPRPEHFSGMMCDGADLAVDALRHEFGSAVNGAATIVLRIDQWTDNG